MRFLFNLDVLKREVQTGELTIEGCGFGFFGLTLLLGDLFKGQLLEGTWDVDMLKDLIVDFLLLG